jgi:hypothetical protein
LVVGTALYIVRQARMAVATFCDEYQVCPMLVFHIAALE